MLYATNTLRKVYLDQGLKFHKNKDQ